MVISIVVNVRPCVAASELTVASMGPAHGVQMRPRAIPRIMPLINSLFICVDFCSNTLPMDEILLVMMVKIFSNDGIIMVSPKKIITTMAMERNISGDMPVICIMLLKVRVKNEKLRIMPLMIPSGL
jgi:hypothetical protein